MISLILLGITWYITKLYYTRNIKVHIKENNTEGLIAAKCVQCSQYILISQEHIRSPFYCVRCN
jgi:hypothetical protein